METVLKEIRRVIKSSNPTNDEKYHQITQIIKNADELAKELKEKSYKLPKNMIFYLYETGHITQKADDIQSLSILNAVEAVYTEPRMIETVYKQIKKSQQDIIHLQSGKPKWEKYIYDRLLNLRGGAKVSVFVIIAEVKSRYNYTVEAEIKRVFKNAKQWVYMQKKKETKTKEEH